jgi:hypothetical protein
MSIVTRLTGIGTFMALCTLAACVDGGMDVSPDPGADPGDGDAELLVDALTDGAGALAMVESHPELRDRVFVASLSGAEEVPPVRTGADGFAVFVLDTAHGRLVYGLRHSVIDASAGHIHTGGGGENGPVAIPFSHFQDGAIGALAITAAQINALRAGKLYINVHSPAHDKGEIRGQILRPGETLYVASLGGAQETPALQSAARGTASFILSTHKDKLTFRVTASMITPTAAHVHRGLAGVAGPVAFELGSLGATIEGTQALNAAQAGDLANGLFYVNLHSAAHPMGEIRGQLLLPGESLYDATLSGTQEVPPVTSTNQGAAMLIVSAKGDAARYVVTTTATPTNEHFHAAPGGQNGPVVLPLPSLGAMVSGTTTLTAAQRADIDRGLWYANVHTVAHPAGELRGQILRPGETLYTAILSPANEVPAHELTASGGVAFILDAERANVRYNGGVTQLVPTAAHIHNGATGVNGPVAYELGFTGGSIAGTQAVTAADLAGFDAGTRYVNVHTLELPMGAIRGQILRP